MVNFKIPDGLKDWAQNIITLGLNHHISAEHGRSHLPGGSNGPADAYRHLLRSAEMYRTYPDGLASGINDFREMIGNTTNSPMDYHNNEIGRIIGQYAEAHGLTAAQTRDLVRETIQKSLCDFTPESIDKQWTPTKDGPLLSPQKNVTLSNGLQVPTITVLPTSVWGEFDPKTANWPDSDGGWLSRFAAETTDYFSKASPELSQHDTLSPSQTPVNTAMSSPTVRK